MSSISYTHSDGDDYVTEITETPNQTAEAYGHIPYRVATISLADGSVANDGTDTETVTVEIVDGLEVARGTAPADASTLAESGTLTLSIDGAEVSVSLSDGTGRKDVTTTKSSGSTIDIEATGYDGGPIEADAVTIEVING